jgi:hypothetical protein
LFTPEEAELGFEVVSKKLARDSFDTILHLAILLVDAHVKELNLAS